MVQFFNRQLGKKKSGRDLGKKKIGIIVIGLLVSSIAFMVLMFDNPASAEFSVENLTIEPWGQRSGEIVEAGEEFMVTVKVVNLRTNPKDFQIELEIDGKKIDTKKISLEAREMGEERFAVNEGLEEGTHTIEVGNLVEEIELKEKENRETELMDDFEDVSGNEDYITPALDINVVSLKRHGDPRELKCELKVSPEIGADIGSVQSPRGTRYVYSLILDQDGDGEKDVTTGIIKKNRSDLDEHEFRLVDYIKTENRFKKSNGHYFTGIGWKVMFGV